MDPTDPGTIAAEPYPFRFSPGTAALLIIDMQRDLLEPGGFGEALWSDAAQLRRTSEPNRRRLEFWRGLGFTVIHTREGQRPDLADLPPAMKIRGGGPATSGDSDPMGRIVVWGDAGHDIIPELYPLAGRVGRRQARQGRVLGH